MSSIFSPKASHTYAQLADETESSIDRRFHAGPRATRRERKNKRKTDESRDHRRRQSAKLASSRRIRHLFSRCRGSFIPLLSFPETDKWPCFLTTLPRKRTLITVGRTAREKELTLCGSRDARYTRAFPSRFRERNVIYEVSLAREEKYTRLLFAGPLLRDEVASQRLPKRISRSMRSSGSRTASRVSFLCAL